jgi:hypothetical protein
MLQLELGDKSADHEWLVVWSNCGSFWHRRPSGNDVIRLEVELFSVV